MAVVAAHNIQNIQRAGQVVGIVLDGLGDALAHCLVSGKLDDAVDVLVLGEDLFDGGLVGHVGLDKAEVLAGDLFHAGQGLGAGVVVVIGHDDIIPGGQKFHAGVAADVTGATAYQNCHNDRLLITYVILLPLAGDVPRLLPLFYFFGGVSAIEVFDSSLSFCCLFRRRAGKPCCRRR